jgi:hypothetical protein
LTFYRTAAIIRWSMSTSQSVPMPPAPRPPTARSARRTIASIVADLVEVHDRLAALRAALPEAAANRADEGVGRGPRAELVGAIECVLHDHLKPAVRSLCLAAALPPDAPAPPTPAENRAGRCLSREEAAAESDRD